MVSGVQDMSRVQDIVVFRNRRCFAEDFSVFDGRGVTGKVANAPRLSEESVYEFKPRTSSFSDGATGVDLRSLFPMQTRTRLEALAMSNSAYFVVHWADLIVCVCMCRRSIYYCDPCAQSSSIWSVASVELVIDIYPAPLRSG